MADRVINNGIVYASSSNDGFFEIKDILEKYFLYQTVLIFDQNFEYGKTIERLKENVCCNFLICHDFATFNFSQNIDFVVCVNGKNIEKIKKYCFDKKLPYMNVLTKIESYYVCCNKIIKSQNQMEINSPFAIILDKNYIFDKKSFVINFILEIATLKFELLQKKINNLFYLKRIDLDRFNEQQKFIDNLFEFFKQKNYAYTVNFDKICETYVTYLVKRVDDEVDLLQKLANLYLKDNTAKIVGIKYIYSQILNLFQTDYFSKFQNGFVDSIDYQLHQKKLNEYGKISSFSVINLPETKFNFLIEQFSHKFLGYCNEQKNFDETIKSIIADIDVDFLFGLYENIDRNRFVDMISLEPTVFSEPNILSLFFSQGLLNYSI